MDESGRVLIVAADSAVKSGFEQALAAKDCKVETVDSGEDALWKLDNDRYEAVISEMELRGINGLELAEEIEARQVRPAVVLILDSDSKSIQERAAAAGVSELLRKPLSAQQIFESSDRIAKAAAATAALRPQMAEAKVAATSPMIMIGARLRNIFLFLTAPLLGLVYVLLFPIIGVGALAWIAVRQLSERQKAAVLAKGIPEQVPVRPTPARPGIVRTLAAIVGAVLVGLAYGIIGPILGIGAIIWFAFEAWAKLGAKAMGPA